MNNCAETVKPNEETIIKRIIRQIHKNATNRYGKYIEKADKESPGGRQEENRWCRESLSRTKYAVCRCGIGKKILEHVYVRTDFCLKIFLICAAEFSGIFHMSLQNLNLIIL